MSRSKSNKSIQKKRKAIIAEQNKHRKDRNEKIAALIPLIKTFVLWLILIGIVLHYKESLKPYLVEFTTISTYYFSSVLFLPVELIGESLLSIFGFNLEVVVECTAYNYYLFVLALVLFARWALRDKILNFLLFIFTIFVLNNFRFIILGYIGDKYPELFHSIHDYFWNILFAFLILGLWVWRNDKAMKKLNTEETT